MFLALLLSRVVASAVVGFPAALAGKGLVIPTEPCSRGLPPYSLQRSARIQALSSSVAEPEGAGIDRREEDRMDTARGRMAERLVA
ncbi:hypothetical protein Taro_039641 [Colocasia esculenta]|uniref:Secreted protein n=1 Tax=Colocasia esculenta TaxID=4460 RepID=A0A843WH50_COLES|nr:hypothetical protein [Colocasia esculenta]